MRVKFIFYSLVVPFSLLISCSKDHEDLIGETEILKWPEGKRAAVSLTYDDGSINQFRIALPMMDSLGFPATFYINTGNIPDSKYQSTFIGRPLDEIIQESSEIPTNPDNLFERASAASSVTFRGLREYHTRAGELYESGKIEESCKVMDEAFEMIRTGRLKPYVRTTSQQNRQNSITWDEIKTIAQRGHEFGSHTISHPRLAVMDEENLLYELEKSREEILNFLGPEHTFSAECPYGTEDERVMEYAYEIYPALRNRMPEIYLAELNRGNRENPGSFNKEYVQWQRGPLTATPMERMKSWIDTCLVNDNIWLVLVFHGVEGRGWEPKTKEELSEYFNYIYSHLDKLWIATFKDVTKYIRERMTAEIETVSEKNVIKIQLSHTLNQELYDYPLNLKTYIPETWESVQVTQNEAAVNVKKATDEIGDFVIYNAIPNSGVIQISGN